MKNYQSVFPFMTTTDIPENIEACLSDYLFRDLTDTLHESKGFAYLTQNDLFIRADNRYLFKYVENKRTANALAVRKIYQERLQKATDKGHELSKDDRDAIHDQARREVLKTAPISEMAVFILYDQNVGRVWCAGSTLGKCQAALKLLRKAIGSLKTTPLAYDFAGHLLARQLCKGEDYVEGFPDNLAIPENAKLVAASEDQKVTFDGVDLREHGVGEVLQGMQVRSVEMLLTQQKEGKEKEVLATFVLHVPKTGPVHLKALDYPGAGATPDDDDAHHYATEMLLVSGVAWQIFDTLRGYFHGANGGAS